jgi:hypothetical protein
MATEKEYWFGLTTGYLRKAPKGYDKQGHDSPRFLTRLCRLCEDREITLLYQIRLHGINVIPSNQLPT